MCNERSELIKQLKTYARFSRATNPSWSKVMTQAAEELEKCECITNGTVATEPIPQAKTNTTTATNLPPPTVKAMQ